MNGSKDTPRRGLLVVCLAALLLALPSQSPAGTAGLAAATAAPSVFPPLPVSPSPRLPLSPSPTWTAGGENLYDAFAFSIAAAGDVNGDGFADVLVGARRYPGGGYRGKAYLYHGSRAGPALDPAWTATGENEGDGFGLSLAAAGDVNGDGFADVIVGAPYYGGSRGRAYLYYGSPAGLSPTPNWTADGEWTKDCFGGSVASGGDVNGDGFADVVVGAPGYFFEKGQAYLYLGSPSGLSPTPAWTATGTYGGDYFGWSLAGAGDVNGDGYADVLVGAPGYLWTLQGRAHLFIGSPAGLSPTPDWTADGENEGDYFGLSLAGAGDLNGDGYADIVIGAPGYGGSQGKAYLYPGSPSGLSATPTWTAAGENAGDEFALSVAGAGDVDGDGCADVLVGAYRYPGGAYRGRVYLYHGSPAGPAPTADWTAAGENDGDQFGYSVAGAGDVDGDGYADLLAGAWGWPSGAGRGRAYLYRGAAATLSPAPAWSAGDYDYGDLFGYSVAAAGDVNGDGYSDVLVGAPRYPSGAYRGKAELYYGSPAGLSLSPGWTAVGENNDDLFGLPVAGAGDVNGDGYADVLVGAPGYPEQNSQGKAYLYYGSPAGLSPSPGWTAAGENDGDSFCAVAGAGDVNGDGFADVLVGAYRYPSGGNQGKAYLYYGSPAGLSPTPAWTASGEMGEDLFGVPMAGAGDINGDGFADVLVGAQSYPGGLYYGKVYLYHGSSAGLSPIPDWTATGEHIADYFGHAVASAGDVNGDGFSDVVVGAPRYPMASHQGKAYLYLGSPAGLSPAPDWTAIGEIRDKFGWSVAGAGDVDGDGFADVLVGLPHSAYKAGGRFDPAPGSLDAGAARPSYPAPEFGRAYLYHGSARGLSLAPAWVGSTGSEDDSFGSAVAPAGDVDGDGYADVIIGAYGDGKAYAYPGNAGGGRLVLPRQVRPGPGGGGVPIQPWGLSYGLGRFEVQKWATDPLGRGRVALQVQACPPGMPFTATACLTHTVPTWTDVTTASSGILLTTTVAGLDADTLYRWRARVLYAPLHVVEPGVTPPPHPPHGPWRRLLAQAQEADLRTARQESAWDKRVYVNGLLIATFPAPVATGDVVAIADRVWVSATAGVTFTLAETWTGGLDLTGWVSDTGRVVTAANALAWEVVNAPAGAWYVITKTWTVQAGPWCLDHVSESLAVEGGQWPWPGREVTFSRYGLAAAPPAGADVGDPGSVVTYTLRVTNSGNCADTFDVAVGGNDWPVQAPTTVGPLGPGEGSAVEVAVEVPPAARCGDRDTAEVTFTSQGDGRAAAASTLTTTANPLAGVAVAPPTAGQAGDPAATVTYTLRVTNTGNCTDTFAVAVGGNLWPTSVPGAVGPLNPGEGSAVEAVVEIPPGARCGEGDTATVTFTSQRDGVTSAASDLSTTANPAYGVTVAPPAVEQAGDPGSVVTYTLGVTNSGNCADTFDVAVGGNLWPVQASATVGPLDPGVGTNLAVTVEIPVSAGEGDLDVATVTLTSSADGSVSDSAVLTTVVLPGWRIYLPLLFQSRP